MKKERVVKCISFFLLTFAFFLTSSILAAEGSPLLLKKNPKEVISDLETMIPRLLKKGRVPGLQLALIREGQVIWTGSFGVKNNATSEPVTDETIFEAASLTKPFFAYAVMKMVEEGILGLDTPLISYLPKEQVEKVLGHPLDFPDFHRDWLEKITPRHVLSHSSGMGEGGKPYPFFFEPGTKYRYAAASYDFLQLVVERLKGEKLETIMKKYVLDPLGMKNSYMIWKEEYEKTMANGHGFFGRPEDFRKRTRAYAYGSLYTTAAEYARFVCEVINGELIKKETLKKMLTPQIDVDKEKGLSWSLGFGLQQDENGSAFWHVGDYGIFKNYIIAYPQHRIALVYLTNSYYGLSICPDLVSRSIGGQALGNARMEEVYPHSYKHYDSPVYEFAWTIKNQGPQVVEMLFPKMKGKHPDDFSQKTIDSLGSVFINEKLYDEALALYELNVNENPKSAKAISQLARAYLEKGDRGQAKLYYQKALKANKDEKFDTKSIDWALAYIKALEEPVKLSVDYLKTLAGDYETRQVKFKDGSLYLSYGISIYYGEEAARKDYLKLIPMSKDTFISEGSISFRLQFEFDEQGRATKIVAMHERGYQHHSIRNKKYQPPTTSY